MVALVALSLSLAQTCGVLVGSQTRFQEIDKKIERVEERWAEAEQVVKDFEPAESELHSKVVKAKQNLLDARSAWLSGNFGDAEELLLKGDAEILEILKSARPAPAADAMPVVTVGIVILAVIGVSILSIPGIIWLRRRG